MFCFQHFKSAFVVLILIMWVSACQDRLGVQNSNLEPNKGWVSSGGEIFQDSNNPWFLSNIPVVRYCILVDQKSFSMPSARIHNLVEQALEYWTKEFELFQPRVTQKNKKALPSPAKKFRKIQCDGTQELTLQFGYGTLDEAQRKYLETRSHLLSIATRTHYDKEVLRGKGFVYLSSDIGEHRYPKDNSYVREPWRHEGLFYQVLLHEIGHVFGLPHIGEGLMSEQFPDHILKKDVYKKYSKIGTPQHFFVPQQEYHRCQLTAEEKEWFQIPEEMTCLTLKSLSKKKGALLDGVGFITHQGPGTEPKLWGLAAVPKSKELSMRMILERAGMLFLPQEQRVFPRDSLEDPDQKYVPTSVFLSMDISLIYANVENNVETKPIYINFSPDGYEILAVVDGVMKSILYHNRRCIGVSFVSACLEP